MSTPYQKVQPHFPTLSMEQVERLLGDTWDFYNNRGDMDASDLASAYLSDISQVPDRLECLSWSEEKWLEQIRRMQQVRMESQAMTV